MSSCRLAVFPQTGSRGRAGEAAGVRAAGPERAARALLPGRLPLSGGGCVVNSLSARVLLWSREGARLPFSFLSRGGLTIVSDMDCTFERQIETKEMAPDKIVTKTFGFQPPPMFFS